MSPTLTLVSLASAQPMGQQVYEEEVARRAADVLGATWDVRRLVVSSMRSHLPGSSRLPSRVLTSGSSTLRRACGLALYARGGVVHRLDMRLPPAARREVLTVLDVVSWRFPDEAAPPPCSVVEARRAAVVVCPSQFSADEVTSVLGVKEPVAIPLGVSRAFFDAMPLSDAGRADLGITTPYLVHAGGCTLRKNLAGLAGAWAKVSSARPDVSLVLVGPPDRRRDELFAPLAGTIRLGRVTDDVLLGLMAGAAGIVVPSVYEGFGLPALEGMAAGTPVVAARRASLPEVCGDAAIMVEPTADGLAEGMIHLLEGGSDLAGLVSRGRTRAAGFTWEASVEAHAAVWRQVGA